jgi:hypothetical protein
MKKRFSTLELVTYRLSNTTRLVYFDTFEEASNFAQNQRFAHPRTRKLNGFVFDSETKESKKVAY